MIYKYRLPGHVFLALYAIGGGLYSFFIVRVNLYLQYSLADELLYLLIFPLLYIVFYYSRIIYFLALIITFLCCTWVILQTNSHPLNSIRTLAGTLFILYCIAEVLSRKSQYIEQTKQELQDSEERYKRLAENARDVIYHMTIPQGRIEYVNSASAQVLGYTPEELYNDSSLIRHLIHPAWKETLKEEWENILRGRIPPYYEYPIRTKSGETKWLHQRNVLIKDNDGNPTAIEGIIADITELKQAADSLQQKERLYREAIEVASAVPYYQSYGDFNYVYVGKGIQELTGYSPEEFSHELWLNISLETILLGNLKGMEMEEAVEKARGEEGVSWRADYRIRTRSGDEKWINNAAIQVRDENGKVIGSLGILQDVTERKQIEEALRKSQSLIEKAQEVARIGFWKSDLKTGILKWDQEVLQIFGFETEGFEGTRKTFYSCVHPEDRDSVKKSVEVAIRQGVPYNIEHRIIRPNGEIAWVHEQGEIVDLEKDSLSLIGTVQDITARKQLEEELHQSQKMETIGKLAGGVAHDFNNLLTIIQGYSSLALSRLSHETPLYNDIEEISRAAERAASITRQLLAFSRKQIFQTKIFQLNSIVTDLEKMLQPLVRDQIEIVMDLNPHLRPIKADPGQIEQIILNLVLNAQDAMPNGGILKIQTQNVDPEEIPLPAFSKYPLVALSIQDTGCGMDQNTLTQIFEPFFTTKEKGKGTGLGLSTVYGIVKQSGGHIEVDTHPGRGTAFTVYLPAMDANLDVIHVENEDLFTLDGYETLLVVEDEESVRKLMVDTLRKYNYVVQDASNAFEALDILKKNSSSIHALISDIVMPGMSGKDLAERVLQEYPQIRILLISGFSDNAMLHRECLWNEIEFLQKPFIPKELLRRVKTLLNDKAPDPVS